MHIYSFLVRWARPGDEGNRQWFPP
jgi:hypothetical protein